MLFLTGFQVKSNELDLTPLRLVLRSHLRRYQVVLPLTILHCFSSLRQCIRDVSVDDLSLLETYFE